MKWVILGGAALFTLTILARWSREQDAPAIPGWTPWRGEMRTIDHERYIGLFRDKEGGEVFSDCGPARIVGSRSHDALMADRERRAGEHKYGRAEDAKAEWRQAQRKRAV